MGVRAQNTTVYSPTSAWLVGPASLETLGAGAATPCLMLNQYENGFTFRFSGGDQRILATAIDFRQDLFTPGARYNISLQIPPSFTHKFSATAYNAGILLLNSASVADAQSFYGALANGTALQLDFPDHSLQFALPGIADGLRRLESCYKPAPAASVADPVMTPVSTPLTQAVAVNAQHWQAKKGDDLQAVLNDWCKKAHARLTWKATAPFPLRESMGIEGTFTQAVHSLLNQYADQKLHPTGRLYNDPATGEAVVVVEQDQN